VFTVEMEDEETIITTIDESGRFGDVKIYKRNALMTWTIVYL
jgi:hypothetical protein